MCNIIRSLVLSLSPAPFDLTDNLLREECRKYFATGDYLTVWIVNFLPLTLMYRVYVGVTQIRYIVIW